MLQIRSSTVSYDLQREVIKEVFIKDHIQILVLDLMKLENGVLTNDSESLEIRAGLVCFIADNLEAAVVGGFSSNFSSNDVCRICHFQYDQLDVDCGHHRYTRNVDSLGV